MGGDNDKQDELNTFENVFDRNKKIILSRLEDYGIAQVRIEYAGSGDSGGVDSVGFFNIAGLEINLPEGIGSVEMELSVGRYFEGRWGANLEKKLLQVKEAVEQMAYDLIDAHHRGCFNNDGAQGHFEIKVANNTIAWDHYDNIISQELTERVL